MIKRIVKLTFRPEMTDTFLREVFEPSKNSIRAFPGCRHMELLRDTQQDNVLFTLSYWDAASDLEAYRQSELFQSTWAKTKILFASKAEAWSLTVLDDPKT
ncbi:MAG: antibiotic biosynthesis monooxygenase [Bacteroidetes bacterium]|nr:MAG: antibiotic biosynthesis monooxygenase [Bacteroidota bacterium]